jgi:hypothetical protein
MSDEFVDNVYSCKALFPEDRVSRLKKDLFFHRKNRRVSIERNESDSLEVFFNELRDEGTPENSAKLRALWESADEFLREKIQQRISQFKENSPERERFDSIIGEKVLEMKL